MTTRLDPHTSPVLRRYVARLISLSQVIDSSTLPGQVQELVKIRASQINGCGLCTDMHTTEALAAGESQRRVNLVAVWRESSVFTPAERAALALTEDGTRLADNPRDTSEETWAAVRAHFDDEQVAALVGLIALINTWNRLNVLTGATGGAYEQPTHA